MKKISLTVIILVAIITALIPSIRWIANAISAISSIIALTSLIALIMKDKLIYTEVFLYSTFISVLLGLLLYATQTLHI